ncbi:MAG TPA: hypothetical protein VEO56_08330, partial [Bacteroidota bacterium]|nr:hypothetical protein [Bacteroidota bacterium]
MTLTIGTIGSSPGWEELLRQEGVPFRRVIVGEAETNAFSTIVVCRAPLKEELAFIREYLRSGGALLGCSTYLRDIVSLEEESRQIAYLTPDGDGDIPGLSLIDVEATGTIAREANCFRTTDHL